MGCGQSKKLKPNGFKKGDHGTSPNNSKSADKSSKSKNYRKDDMTDLIISDGKKTDSEKVSRENESELLHASYSDNDKEAKHCSPTSQTSKDKPVCFTTSNHSHLTASQIEFFRMVDEKIARGKEYDDMEMEDTR